MTHYQVLELPENAPAADIRRAYRRLVLLTHPDRTPDPAAHASFLAINAAYEVLSDPARRQIYDTQLLRPTPTAAPKASPGRARDAAHRAATRTTGAQRPVRVRDFATESARFLRVVRPVMIGTLLFCASLALDFALAREGQETVLRTNLIAYQHVIHYTTGGRFALEEALPIGAQLWVNRTPLWRTAISAQLLSDGTTFEFASLYDGSSNLFWLGLGFAAFISLRPQFSNDQRLMASLVAVVCLILTLSGLFSI